MAISSGENKRSHLAMIENIIERMATNCFSIKKWSISVIIAVFAFVGEDSDRAALITLMPLMVFWFLDAYYLLIERKYRLLYKTVCNKEEKDIDFDMDYSKIIISISETKKYCFARVLFSVSVFPFYLVCVVTTVAVYFIQF